MSISIRHRAGRPKPTVPVGGPARRHFCCLFYNASCHRHHRFLCFRGTSSLSLITASRWRSLPAKLRGNCPRTFRASGSARPLGRRSTAFTLLPSLSLGRFPILLPSSSALCSVSSDFSSCSVSSRFPRGCDLKANGCAFKGNDVVGNSRLFILSLTTAGAAFANRMRRLRTMPPSSSSSYSEFLTISECLHPIGCRNRWFSSHERPPLAENLSTRTA